jgi:hypothetical protein
MRKLFVVLEVSQLNNEENRQQQAGLRVELPPRWAQRPAAPRQARVREGDMPEEPRWNEKQAHIIICHSLPEAEEYVDETLASNPQFKFVILESIALLETVPSPTLTKMWDANGQLVEKKDT